MSVESKLIYRILRFLQLSLDIDEPDFSPIEAESLDITKAKWSRIIKMLVDDGYISGVNVISVNNAPYPIIRLTNSTAITLKGLEYLDENSMMQKAAKIAKGALDVIK